MKKNECFPMTADRLGADLEGICIHEGMPVFVPGLLPGEGADIKIVKAEKRYAFGRMESRPDPASPDRREPDCASYPRCGGFKIIRPRNAPNPNNPPQFARGHSLRLPRLSALRLAPGRCSLGSAIRTVVRTLNPNNPPQFAKGHSPRLSRLSALRLVPGRCSLASATRTVHWTV